MLDVFIFFGEEGFERLELILETVDGGILFLVPKINKGITDTYLNWLAWLR